MRGIPINKKSNSFNRETTGETWDINELETFFKSQKLSKLQVKVSEYMTINDVEKFVNAHLEFVKANNGNRTFEPYFERLNELKNIMLNTF